MINFIKIVVVYFLIFFYWYVLFFRYKRGIVFIIMCGVGEFLCFKNVLDYFKKWKEDFISNL